MKRFLAVLTILVLCLSASAETLSVGSRSDEVKAVQQRLVETGYLSGGADGIYGEKTAKAVKLFQYLNGMEQTGKVDETVSAALYSDSFRFLRPALTGGDKGEEVQALQEMLIRYGFLTGKADGEYGEKTRNAVVAFQEHLIAQGIDENSVAGVSATGVATGLTQEYLFSETYTTHLRDIAPGATDDSEVRRIERRIVELGYMDAEADKNYDDYAADCVHAFQQAENLAVTGTVDRATVDRLFAADAAAAEHFVPHAIVEGDKGELVKDVQNAFIRYGFMDGIADGVYGQEMGNAIARFREHLEADYDDRASLYTDITVMSVEAQQILTDGDFPTYTWDIMEDAPRSATLRVQRRLQSLFYLDKTDLDGDYGKTTAEAISLFQENNNLPVTGVADEATQAVLFSENPTGDWTPYMLHVSIADQRVYVNELQDGQYVQIDEFICSTGYGSSTPVGVFTSTRPLYRWHHFKDFKCYAQYSYQIQGNILFHSILYDRDDVKTLRESSLYALGQKASHGCVRLKPEAAKWIFENCEKGTIVVITG